MSVAIRMALKDSARRTGDIYVISKESEHVCTVACCTQAIDVWTGVCIFFVFGALLEYALVNYASRSDAQVKKTHSQRGKLEVHTHSKHIKNKATMSS